MGREVIDELENKEHFKEFEIRDFVMVSIWSVTYVS